MTDLFEKSIVTLELPRVLEQLSACAATQEGKERALALRPLTEPDDVQRALDETSAAGELLILRRKISCPFSVKFQMKPAAYLLRFYA